MLRIVLHVQYSYIHTLLGERLKLCLPSLSSHTMGSLQKGKCEYNMRINHAGKTEDNLHHRIATLHGIHPLKLVSKKPLHKNCSNLQF